MADKGKSKKTQNAGPRRVSVLVCDGCKWCDEPMPFACGHLASPKHPYLTVIFLAPGESASKGCYVKTPDWCPLL